MSPLLQFGGMLGGGVGSPGQGMGLGSTGMAQPQYPALRFAPPAGPPMPRGWFTQDGNGHWQSHLRPGDFGYGSGMARSIEQGTAFSPYPTSGFSSGSFGGNMPWGSAAGVTGGPAGGWGVGAGFGQRPSPAASNANGYGPGGGFNATGYSAGFNGGGLY